MSKCMVRSDGLLIKVSATEAAELHSSGKARYISKDEYRRKLAEKEAPKPVSTAPTHWRNRGPAPINSRRI